MTRGRAFEIILIGKNNLRLEGIARILREADFRILASVSSADNWIARKTQLNHALFLVVHAGDDFDSTVEQIELFRNRHPGGRIAVVTERYRLDELISTIRAGATGYFVDATTCDVFIRSLELVAMGETVYPTAFLSIVLTSEGDHSKEGHTRRANSNAAPIMADDIIVSQLSPREKAILHCMIAGDSNKSIARKIDIAEATVKVHVKAILRKIRVQNRTQAAIWGMNNRSLTRPEDEGRVRMQARLL